jgi:hypothetical protein
MTRSANCPNCGAPIRFRFSSAVQTTCEFCRSILVRTGIDLNRVGQVADFPPDSSPIQIGSEGVYRNKAFTAVGRILYQYEHGGWNEWHLAFQDGASGWLSDAQSQYAVTFVAKPSQPLGDMSTRNPGSAFTEGGVEYRVASITRAHYAGVEGELPFEYWDKSECVFVDLRSPDRRLGTIDYTEDPPLLFLGEFVEFDTLRLSNLRQFEGW